MDIANSSAVEPDSGYGRVEEQIRWYDQKSNDAQWWFKRSKVTEVACAAIIPLISTICPIGASALGAAILVLETLQHLNQWQHNWVTYRSTCEALRHEKYTYLARSGPYDGADADLAKKLLAERVESLISREHSKWISSRDSATKRIAEGDQHT